MKGFQLSTHSGDYILTKVLNAAIGRGSLNNERVL